MNPIQASCGRIGNQTGLESTILNPCTTLVLCVTCSLFFCLKQVLSRQEIKYVIVSKGPPAKSSVHRSWLPFHQTLTYTNANVSFLPSIALKGRQDPWLLTAGAAFKQPEA